MRRREETCEGCEREARCSRQRPKTERGETKDRLQRGETQFAAQATEHKTARLFERQSRGAHYAHVPVILRARAERKLDGGSVGMSGRWGGRGSARSRHYIQSPPPNRHARTKDTRARKRTHAHPLAHTCLRACWFGARTFETGRHTTDAQFCGPCHSSM